MRHPEVDYNKPSGYSVHWSPVWGGNQFSTPWLKIFLIGIGFSMLCFASGYFWAARQSAQQIEEAEALKAEAEAIQASASGDLDIARAKVAEQQQRLRLVNDCVYSALNEPVPTPVPSPAK